MPIYAYRCQACGHAKDVLQKISDPVLTTCPACSAEAFVKQVTAAGFQLKGSGWYVTDFRGGSSGGPGANATGGADKPSDGGKTEGAKPGEGSAGAGGSSSSSDSGGGSAASGGGGSTSSGGAGATAAAAGCGTSCACH